MSDSKLRFGIVGIGSFSAGRHVPNLRETGKAEIVAICRRNQELLDLAGPALEVSNLYNDWHRMIDEVQLDAVVVSTPNHMHAECAVEAMQKGLHVLVEKPMALSIEDATNMISVSQQTENTLSVGYNCRYLSHWQSVKKHISEGYIGIVRQITASYGVNARWFWQREKAALEEFSGDTKSEELKSMLRADAARDNHWRTDSKQIGGSLFVEVGTHLVDLMHWLTASKPIEVFAYSNTADMPVEAFITAQARLDSGTMLSLTFGEGVNGSEELLYGKGRLTIHGDDGIIEAKWSGWNPSRATVAVESRAGRLEFEPSSADTNPAAAFVEAVLQKGPNYAPPEECVNAVLFTESVYKSIRDNRPILVSG